MIIFNTIKSAQHYVKWRNKTKDFFYNGTDYSQSTTYIDRNYVKVNESGDGCGCGCDMYRYENVYVIGRIKAFDVKSTRAEKLNKVIKNLE